MADAHSTGQTSGISQDTNSDPQTAYPTKEPGMQDNGCTEHVTSSDDVITQDAPESELRRVKSYEEIDIQSDDIVEEATGAGADGDEEAGTSATTKAVFIHGDVELEEALRQDSLSGATIGLNSNTRHHANTDEQASTASPPSITKNTIASCDTNTSSDNNFTHIIS